MRSVVLSVLASFLLLAVPAESRATQRNGRGVEETLRRAQEECCPARNRGEYVSCAAHVCNRAIKRGILNPPNKVIILKHGCDDDVPSTTTTTKPSTTSTTSTTKPTCSSTTTSTTEPHRTTSSTTTSTTQSTTTTESSTSTTKPEPTTTSTTEPYATSTTTSIPASTTTTTLPGHEICGNCLDDDANGLTDFEDPACCADLQTFSMSVSRGRLRPVGAVSRLRLKSLLARAGLDHVNPMQQDVFLQIRSAGGAELLCAKIPAAKFMRMHGAFKFWDRKHVVTTAKGINDLTVKIRRNGSVKFRTLGRRVQMATPTHGPLHVTVGFHDPAGDAGNRCSSTVQQFRTAKRNALRAP